MDRIDLPRKANTIRKSVVKMVARGGGGHIGSALSIVDIVTVLYFGVLKVDPSKPDWKERDRFVLSKGHGCVALYAALAHRGFFPVDLLDTFYQDGTTLLGHPELQKVPGLECSSGSLGHGLSIGVGFSLAAKADHLSYRTFVLLGDGECDEGSVWEAAMSAGHFRLDNLVAIVDYNKIQATGPTSEVMSLEPLAAKWRAFGWAVREVDGNDAGKVLSALSRVPFRAGKPSVLIAHTIKGKGVSFMENQVIWHYRTPDLGQEASALKELEGQMGW